MSGNYTTLSLSIPTYDYLLAKTKEVAETSYLTIAVFKCMSKLSRYYDYTRGSQYLIAMGMVTTHLDSSNYFLFSFRSPI